MKNQVLGLLAIGLLAACGGSAGTKGGNSFGTAFDDAKAISVDDAVKTFKAGGEKNAVIKGEISAVCQSEGCWYNFKTKDGEVRVDFDHKFTIPKDSKGSMASANGHFFYDTTSVEQLKEWATDDKKSAEEISKITEPEITLIFRAEGVKITK